LARATPEAPRKGATVRLNRRQRLAWLRLIRSENVGPSTFRALVNEFGGAEAAIDALPMLSRRGGRVHDIRLYSEDEAEGELAAAEALGAHLVAIGEPGYPPALAEALRRAGKPARSTLGRHQQPTEAGRGLGHLRPRHRRGPCADPRPTASSKGRTRFL
jgi:DprA/Smf-like nucleotide binding protein involved in DNA uptake